MAHTLPELPFAYDALAPHIDERTMQIHHGKHHAGYVAKLNAALDGTGNLREMSVDELIGNLSQVPEAKRGAVRNNGGGHSNHSLFWSVMTPGGAAAPEGELAAAIDSAFGSLDGFKTEFGNACATRFGSGWGWLSVGANGGLVVESTANQDSPLMEGRVPILGCDVWEHAYYLNYQNRRPDYVSAWWSVVNWSEVGNRFSAAR